MNATLFGHLAMRFASSPENMATEALAYILGRSHAARLAFSTLLNQYGSSLPPELRFETQSTTAEDPSIPDLAGLNENGQAVLLGEIKFWAGLTDNQPAAYLARLKRSGGNCLIFIVPSKRVSALWPELVLRLKEAGISWEIVPSDSDERRVAKIEGVRRLLMLSWSTLLTALHQALEVQGEREALADLEQLRGLCARMDDTAFLPLQSEELTGHSAHRFTQYCDLVDEIVQELVEKQGASRQNVRAAAGRGYYTRYFYMQAKACSVAFSPQYWQRWRPTPIWLTIAKAYVDKKAVPDPEAHRQLASLEFEEPSRLFQDGDLLVVPILLSLGTEKAEVVRNAADQVNDVFQRMLGHGSSAGPRDASLEAARP